MPTDEDTLKLIRLYRSLPPDAQRALLQCATLLYEDPPEMRIENTSLRQQLIHTFRFHAEYFRGVRRRRQATSKNGGGNGDA